MDVLNAILYILLTFKDVSTHRANEPISTRSKDHYTRYVSEEFEFYKDIETNVPLCILTHKLLKSLLMAGHYFI